MRRILIQAWCDGTSWSVPDGVGEPGKSEAFFKTQDYAEIVVRIKPLLKATPSAVSYEVIADNRPEGCPPRF